MLEKLIGSLTGAPEDANNAPEVNNPETTQPAPPSAKETVLQMLQQKQNAILNLAGNLKLAERAVEDLTKQLAAEQASANDLQALYNHLP